MMTAPKLSDGPSLASPCADFSPEVEEQSLVEDEEELGLPPGGMFTVFDVWHDRGWQKCLRKSHGRL